LLSSKGLTQTSIQEAATKWQAMILQGMLIDRLNDNNE
jgi:hypothetical protein